MPVPVREHWGWLDWVFEASGTAALARVKAGVRPRLALINLQLPDMIGTELIGRLRKGLPGLPVIAVADVGSELLERLARPLGLVAYLTKPLDAGLVDQILSSCLRDVASLRQRTVGLDTVGGE